MAKIAMILKPNLRRLVAALRLAFYPAFEPASEKHFEALRVEAENARGSGDFAKAEKIYLTAMAEAEASSDPSRFSQIRMDSRKSTKNRADIAKRSSFFASSWTRL